jgi:hypothetical protein
MLARTVGRSARRWGRAVAPRPVTDAYWHPVCARPGRGASAERGAETAQLCLICSALFGPYLMPGRRASTRQPGRAISWAACASSSPRAAWTSSFCHLIRLTFRPSSRPGTSSKSSCARAQPAPTKPYRRPFTRPSTGLAVRTPATGLT